MDIKEKYWFSAFEGTILIKAIVGSWEALAGFLLFILSKNTLNHGFITITRSEFSEYPQDAFIHSASLQLQHIPMGTKDLAAIVILFRGLINLLLAYNLYRNMRWAYLVSCSASAISLSYFSYVIISTHSLFALALVSFDIAFLTLTVHEYRYRSEIVR